ncbi:unnamed protein product, partial [Didymodactylos carnosus]
LIGKPISPLQKHHCTDILCLIIFFLFIIGYIIFAAIVFTSGNPSQLLHPTDSQGQICGEEPYEDKKYLFFFDITQCLSWTTLIQRCSTKQICVQQCPTTDMTNAIIDARSNLFPSNRQTYRSQLVCDYGIDPNMAPYDTLTASQLVQQGKCASYTLASSSIAGRCFPTIVNLGLSDTAIIYNDNDTNQNFTFNASNGQQLTTNLINQAIQIVQKLYGLQVFAEKIGHDIYESLTFIAIGSILAIILTFLVIILMRYWARPLVWLILLALVGGLIFSTYYTFNQYIVLRSLNTTSTATFQFQTDISDYFSYPQTWLALGIISAIVLLIVLLILFVLRKRIRIALALIKEASRAIGKTPTTLIWPIIPLLLCIGIIVLCGSMAVFTASSSKPLFIVVNASANCCSTYTNGSYCIPSSFNAMYNNTGASCVFLNYGYADNYAFDQLPQVHQYYREFIRFLNKYKFIPHLYNLFGFLWFSTFITGFHQLVLAGAFASYYWTMDKTRFIGFPLLSSIKRSLLYHVGSVAFGSLIIAIIKMIRIIFQFIENRLKNRQGTGILRCCIRCIGCCCLCFERFFKFINRNAYIMISIYSKHFLHSAKTAFKLIINNPLRAIVLDKVTDFLIFLGVLFITALIGILAYLFFSGKIYLTKIGLVRPDLNYFWCPIILIVIITFLIAISFFDVFEMAVDTLFLCALKDMEVNNGTIEKPYYMTKSLAKVLNKYNKVPQAVEGK